MCRQLIEGSATNLQAKVATETVMLERLDGNQDLIEKLVPNWSLGCMFFNSFLCLQSTMPR